ncbi:MAG: phosphoenolpyruvate synthase [Deltaproteobacteria bacterium]|nr:phosphoenolpyruvate synthase [Deltaproteobacteria bacterium]
MVPGKADPRAQEESDLTTLLDRLNVVRWWKSLRRPQTDDQLTDVFRAKYERFKDLLDSNTELSKIITDLEVKLQGHETFGMAYIRSMSARAVFYTLRMVRSLEALSGKPYPLLHQVLEELNTKIKDELQARREAPVADLVLPYSAVTKEMVDWVGGKNANLGEVCNRVHLPIPDGFAITTRAFHLFLSANNLVDEIQKMKMELDVGNPESLNQVSEGIQRLIISSPVPEELHQAMVSAWDALNERFLRRSPSGTALSVSLRSSAIGEDSHLSFAGQYLSLLNVTRDRLAQSYRYIIASLFTPRAMAYRLTMGIPDEHAAMSVACLEMVESVASGVIYSRHPFEPGHNEVIISAVWGLGPYAVDGVITPDSYRVNRDSQRSVVEKTVAHKPVQLVRNPEGGLMEMEVPLEKQDAPCLTPAQISELADYAIRLEEHYGLPQDVEWALDPGGRLLILQTRPLQMESGLGKSPVLNPSDLENSRLLLSDGAVASPGVGCGPAFQVRSDEDLKDFPAGAVLVAKHSSPKYVVVMQKAQAIITDTGSVTGHMASVARELRVPTVLGMKGATQVIPNGMVITVDAFGGRVFEGRVEKLLELQTARETHMTGTPVHETLSRIAAFITPLRLLDPRSPSFTPEHCRSLHDIMRFVHETCYHAMFQISDIVSNGASCAVSLNAQLPIDLCIIDLGGGLAKEVKVPRRVRVEEVTSAPFKALLRGMTHEGVRYLRPRPVDLGGFLSVMGQQMLSNEQTAERFGDRSYAIVSDKYLNFSSRVGYHYSVLDAYCGQTLNKNYITFSFKGGAADDLRRNRRARAIALILLQMDFSVDVTGDRVDARFQKYEAPVIEEKLDLIGRLLMFTRQMDMLMTHESRVEQVATAFMEGNYDLD